jgi:hypothetical protein
MTLESHKVWGQKSLPPCSINFSAFFSISVGAPDRNVARSAGIAAAPSREACGPDSAAGALPGEVFFILALFLSFGACLYFLSFFLSPACWPKSLSLSLSSRPEGSLPTRVAERAAGPPSHTKRQPQIEALQRDMVWSGIERGGGEVGTHSLIVCKFVLTQILIKASGDVSCRLHHKCDMSISHKCYVKSHRSR